MHVRTRVHAYAHTQAGACEEVNRSELELQVLVSCLMWVLGAKPRFFVRAVWGLKCRAIFLAHLLIKKKNFF